MSGGAALPERPAANAAPERPNAAPERPNAAPERPSAALQRPSAAFQRPSAVVERPKNGPADPQKFAVQVRPSRIDGLGAFAAEAIPARRKIGEIRGAAISVREARRRAKALAAAGAPIMIVEVSGTRAIDAAHSADPLRYTNHCCAPNTTLRVRQGRIELYARRDIAAGEELTAHYGESHHAGRLACRCGAPDCAGRL